MDRPGHSILSNEFSLLARSKLRIDFNFGFDDNWHDCAILKTVGWCLGSLGYEYFDCMVCLFFALNHDLLLSYDQVVA